MIFKKTNPIKTTLTIALGLMLTFSLSTCKKYPENTLWFKNPSCLPVIEGHITSYIVNGIDSLDLLNLYYAPVQPNAPYPYSKTERDIKKETFIASNKGNYFVISSDLFDDNDFFILKWNKDKKSIYFSGDFRRNYYNKQLFITGSGDINWQIIYLDKNQKKSKIKTTYNGNTYEITFEN